MWKRGDIAPKEQNIVEKRRNCSNFSFFSEYFQYIFNFRSQITYSCVKCGSLISFFLNSAYLMYRSMNVSKYFRESLWTEITRVIYIFSLSTPITCHHKWAVVRRLTWLILSRMNSVNFSHRSWSKEDKVVRSNTEIQGSVSVWCQKCWRIITVARWYCHGKHR